VVNGGTGNIIKPQPCVKTMVSDPDEALPKKPKSEIVIGQDISTMSEFELSARIEALEAEIVRCREAIAARRSTKAAADAFFKKS
jgi:uncharacterized small protein (DUF1192 family)